MSFASEIARLSPPEIAVGIALTAAVLASGAVTTRRWKTAWALPFGLFALRPLLANFAEPAPAVGLRGLIGPLMLVAVAAAWAAASATADRQAAGWTRLGPVGSLVVVCVAGLAAPSRVILDAVVVTVLCGLAVLTLVDLRRAGSRSHRPGLLVAGVLLYPVAAAIALQPAPSWLAASVRLLSVLLVGIGALTQALAGRLRELSAEVESLLSQHHHLAQLAEVDPLTGCANRHALRTWLDAWDGSDSITIVVLDVDDLKRINDRHGHAAGDLALQLVAGILKDAVRSDDLVVRWGGDEFVAVMTDTGEKTAMHRFGQLIRLLTAAADEFPYEEPLRASWGVASCASREEAAEALHEADRRMYEMKRQRRREG